MYLFIYFHISGRWKSPVGQFFVNKIDAEIQSQLVVTAIRLAEENGLCVRVLTSDGTNVNPATMAKLGVRYHQNEMSALIDKEFSYGKEIYFTLDACHMLKLARNSLAHLQVLFE